MATKNYLASLKPYGKSVLAILGTVIAGLITALTDNNVSDAEWVNIAILGVGAVAVFFGPNTQYAKYTKTVLSGLTAGLITLQSAITNGVTQTETLQIVLAVLTAIGVYTVGNKGARA